MLQLGCRRLIQYQIEIQLQFSISLSVQFSESAAKVDLVQLGCRSCSRIGGGRPEPSAQGYEFALKLSQFAHDDDDDDDGEV